MVCDVLQDPGLLNECLPRNSSANLGLVSGEALAQIALAIRLVRRGSVPVCTLPFLRGLAKID